MNSENFGRTIQLFLVDGSPNGLLIATLHGWTGSILVCRQSTFDKFLKRPELDRAGVYILFGQDEDNALMKRAYIGEAESVKERITQSAANHGFWEMAIAITTSDDALTKGHVRYLEARLLELAQNANRATLANTQMPDVGKRRLPEADKANMEAFLANIKIVLPVVGLDLLKPQPTVTFLTAATQSTTPPPDKVRFEIRHKSGVKAFAIEEDGEFVVLKDSEALKDTNYSGDGYAELRRELIEQGILIENPSNDRYIFSKSFAFKSPSAAAAVVLDRNSNGRWEWKVEGKKQTYHEWQAQKSI